MATIPKGAERGSWTPPKGRRWTRGDGEQMVAALGTSGLSAHRFAEEHGLSAQRVYWWRDRLRSQRDGTQAAPALIPVRIVEQERREGQDGTLEIVLRDGAVVRVPRRVDLGWLREVVAALEEGTC